jgi:hypothetical protein
MIQLLVKEIHALTKSSGTNKNYDSVYAKLEYQIEKHSACFISITSALAELGKIYASAGIFTKNILITVHSLFDRILQNHVHVMGREKWELSLKCQRMFMIR